MEHSVPIFLQNLQGIGLSLSFSRPSIKREIFLEDVKVFDPFQDEILAEFRQTPLTKEMAFRASHPDPYIPRFVPAQGRAAKCVSVTKRPDYWKFSYESCHKHRADFLQLLRDTREKQKKDDRKKTPTSSIEPFSNEEVKPITKREIDEAIAFYATDFSLDAFIDRHYRDQIGTVIALDGFIPIRALRMPGAALYERILTGSTDPWWMETSSDFQVGHLATAAGRALDTVLTRLLPLGPSRKSPERNYIASGASPESVGYRGHLLPDLLYSRPDLVKEANKWMKKLELGYQLKIQRIGRREEEVFQVRLLDTQRKRSVEVGFPDVGFGMSQILPFIVQSLMTTQRIISLEHPEVYIHPKLQADIGDLLADSIKEPRQHQFIIETHSEHLALRLQKLVRTKVLHSRDVSVVYVKRGENGSVVIPLRLDEGGDFMDDFPGGFFPERLRELR